MENMASNIPDDGTMCPVCFETYKRPKILTCGHTFCETCIHKYIMKCKKERLQELGIECPLCRTLTPVQSDPMQPENWAKSLSLNFALVAILSANADGKEYKKVVEAHVDSECQFVCQPCLDHEKDVKATVFCVDCSKYQCSECANMHSKFGVMKNHVFTSIVGNEDKVNFLSFVNKIQLCETHQKKFKYTCLTHDNLCCSTCLIESHKTCNYESIEKASKTLSFEKMRKSMMDLNIKVKSASDFWSTRKKNIQTQAQSLMAEIQARRERVMEMFDALEKHSMLMLENHARSPEYNRNQENCENLSANIDANLLHCEAAMKYGTPVQKYILSRHLKKKCSDIYLRSEKAFKELASTKVMINFLPIGEETKRLCEQLGSLSFSSSPINIDDIEDHLDSRLKLKYSTEQSSSSWFRSIDFLADGRLVGVDYFKNKLVLFDKELNCIFEHDLDDRPFSVKALSTADTTCLLVATGDAKRLLYFELKADDTLYLVKSIPMKGCVDTIAPVDNNTFFVRLFGCRKPLGRVSLGGDENDVSIDLPEKEYTAENSKCAFDNQSRKLALSDKNSDTVFIFDIKNNHKIAMQSESIMQPREVVFGPDDTLFICSSGTNSIVHATTDGKVLTSRRLKTLHPYALCISKDKRHLAVANMEKNEMRISVFDIV